MHECIQHIFYDMLWFRQFTRLQHTVLTVLLWILSLALSSRRRGLHIFQIMNTWYVLDNAPDSEGDLWFFYWPFILVRSLTSECGVLRASVTTVILVVVIILSAWVVSYRAWVVNISDCTSHKQAKISGQSSNLHLGCDCQQDGTQGLAI